jgi:hypothetical protein
LSQAIVRAAQVVPIMVPLSARSLRQHTRSPLLSFLDSVAVIVRLAGTRSGFPAATAWAVSPAERAGARTGAFPRTPGTLFYPLYWRRPSFRNTSPIARRRSLCLLDKFPISRAWEAPPCASPLPSNRIHQRPLWALPCYPNMSGSSNRKGRQWGGVSGGPPTNGRCKHLLDLCRAKYRRPRA